MRFGSHRVLEELLLGYSQGTPRVLLVVRTDLDGERALALGAVAQQRRDRRAHRHDARLARPREDLPRSFPLTAAWTDSRLAGRIPA